MKKIFSLLLLLFLSLGVVGCTNPAPTPDDDNNQQEEEPQDPEDPQNPEEPQDPEDPQDPEEPQDPEDPDNGEVSFLDAEIAKVVIPVRVTNSILLPTELADGAIDVYWESTNEDVIASDGSFFMPEIDTELTLKATFYYNEEVREKEYNVLAYTKESGFAVAYKMYSGAVQNVYTYSTPFSTVKYKDYKVKFESLNKSALSDEGVIVQKDFDQEVIVRITITKSDTGVTRVYYKRVIVKQYSNETYATYIADWAKEKFEDYLEGRLESLPTEHEKWPSKIEWTSGDNIAVTADNKLIKPIEYVDDVIGLKVTYGLMSNDPVIIETTVLVEDYGGNTEEGFYDQWLEYIMPTDIIAHKNVVKSMDQFDYQYPVNTGAVLNLMNGQPLTFDKSYYIDINESGLEKAWGGRHPELPDTLSSTNASSTRANISSLDAFYEHFRPYYGWDENATIAEKQARYQEYKNNLPNEENILWIVVHESGMPGVGNNAELLARIQRQQADGERAYRQASWNYQIDHEKIYQSFDDTVYCWHAGGDYGKYLPLGNSNSIGIEMCINEDGNYDGAMAHDAKLVAYLLYKYNLKMENVVRHHDTSGKICPNYMIETNRYGEFLEKVRNEYNAIKYLRDAEVTWTISNPELFEKGPHGLYYAKEVSQLTDVNVTLKVVKGSYTFERTVTITLRPDSK